MCDEDKFLGICDHCGKKKTVFTAGDPYTEELHPEEENPDEIWCDDCYQERIWNI